MTPSGWPLCLEWNVTTIEQTAMTLGRKIFIVPKLRIQATLFCTLFTLVNIDPLESRADQSYSVKYLSVCSVNGHEIPWGSTQAWLSWFLSWSNSLDSYLISTYQVQYFGLDQIPAWLLQVFGGMLTFAFLLKTPLSKGLTELLVWDRRLIIASYAWLVLFFFFFFLICTLLRLMWLTAIPTAILALHRRLFSFRCSF